MTESLDALLNPEDILDNALMKEIMSIRIDTLWKRIGVKTVEGKFPKVHHEESKGDLDNFGALFIPGGLVLEENDGNRIIYDKSSLDEIAFREKIRQSMEDDGATLIFPDGIAPNLLLDNGIYSKIVRSLYENQRVAMEPSRDQLTPRKKISSKAISLSMCPKYFPDKYGTRTTLSSLIAVGLIEPELYGNYASLLYNLSDNDKTNYLESIFRAKEPVQCKDGDVLAPPYVVVCHSSRYKQEIITGITRILGIGAMGEFATFSLEEATSSLLESSVGDRSRYLSDHYIAKHGSLKVAGVLKLYGPSKVGTRTGEPVTHLIVPKEFGIDVKEITETAKERYKKYFPAKP